MTAITPLNVEMAGLQLIGSAHLPDQAEQAVLMLHGFTGNRVEYTYFFVTLARVLAERGIAVFRFDFLGCGESDGEFAEVSVANQAAQTQHLLAYLAKNYPQYQRHLLGFSMGGLVALQTALADSALIRSLCLLAPAANLAQIVESVAASNPQLGAAGGVDFLGLEISAQFRQELAQLAPFSGLASLEVPALVVHGQADAAVPVEIGEQVAACLPCCQFEAWADADHTFARQADRLRLGQRIADFVLA
ncbi:alpha/beta hydrolase family protein [Deefgea piscis]|uniref:alpha/beta hydrolase family protein n=1 Tax=Deefgea piscis TaxID=2739061 RepID=UPI001C7F1A19|nr:alpha/beta fold hydrolase [Deefgea piscis]QZA81387.1 lysophospholipase [Deefgea piscis]